MSTSSKLSATEREALILSHLPQVELLARRQHRRWPEIELDDLISAGTVGLIQAVDRFDASRNLKLKTFAEHRIRGALMDYLRQLDPLPRTLREFQKKRDAALKDHFNEGEPPTFEQTAQSLGLSSARYCRLCVIVAASATISLAEAPVPIRRLAS